MSRFAFVGISFGAGDSLGAQMGTVLPDADGECCLLRNFPEKMQMGAVCIFALCEGGVRCCNG